MVRNEALLQCDICERYACAECLQVYDIFSGYDFLCHECAQGFEPPPPGTREPLSRRPVSGTVCPDCVTPGDTAAAAVDAARRRKSTQPSTP